ncbi:MAG: cytochrome c [Nitrospinaceae bacterium]|nr:cytochrome c [Nitrospinaceae bacterium]
MKQFLNTWSLVIIVGLLGIFFAYPAFAHEGHMMMHNHPYPKMEFSEEKGKNIYAKNCASCHGQNGDGKSPVAAALNPKPTNFLDLKYMPMRSRVDHYEAIANGRAKTTMAPWKNILSENDIWNVVAYIEHLFNHQNDVKSKR